MDRILSARRPQSAAAIAAARPAIERIVRTAVPTFADFCLVHLVAGRVVTCVAGAHSTRGGGRDMRALMKVHRIRPDDRDSTVAQVVRTHRVMLRNEIYPETSRRSRAGVGELHRRLATTSALVVPIVHRGTVLGAVSLCYSHSGRAYADRHVAAAERLASRIADALVPIGAPLDVRATATGASGRRRLALRP